MGSPSPGSASPPLPQLAASAAQGLVASTSTLNPNAPPFHGFPASARSGGMLRFSDSEASSGSGESEPPSPTGRGKAVLPSRRHRRRRRPRQNPEGFMPAARRAHPAPAAAPAPTRLASLVVHPARMSAAPDAEGFGQVESRRRWRRAAPSRPSKPVPPERATVLVIARSLLVVPRPSGAAPPRACLKAVGASPPDVAPRATTDVVLPPSSPSAGAADPLTELVVIPRMPALQAAEDALSFALVALVGGIRPDVSPGWLRMRSPSAGIVRFRRSEDRYIVLNSPPPSDAPFTLIWRRWKRT
nr:translation initiation factor IF-2-like [Setaria viridis]